MASQKRAWASLAAFSLSFSHRLSEGIKKAVVGPERRQGYKSALTWLVWLRRWWIFHEFRRASQVSRSICLLSYFIPCNMHLFTCWLNISQRPPKRTQIERSPLARALRANKRRVKSYNRGRRKNNCLLWESQSRSAEAMLCWPWEMQKMDRGSDVECIRPLSSSIFQEYTAAQTKKLFDAYESDASRNNMIEMQGL